MYYFHVSILVLFGGLSTKIRVISQIFHRFFDANFVKAKTSQNRGSKLILVGKILSLTFVSRREAAVQSVIFTHELHNTFSLCQNWHTFFPAPFGHALSFLRFFGEVRLGQNKGTPPKGGKPPTTPPYTRRLGTSVSCNALTYKTTVLVP